MGLFTIITPVLMLFRQVVLLNVIGSLTSMGLILPELLAPRDPIELDRLHAWLVQFYLLFPLVYSFSNIDYFGFRRV